jgi:hypothetical protein
MNRIAATHNEEIRQFLRPINPSTLKKCIFSTWQRRLASMLDAQASAFVAVPLHP